MPTARATIHERPFKHTRMDYFGSMAITIGRRREKHCGLMFVSNKPCHSPDFTKIVNRFLHHGSQKDDRAMWSPIGNLIGQWN